MFLRNGDRTMAKRYLQLLVELVVINLPKVEIVAKPEVILTVLENKKAVRTDDVLTAIGCWLPERVEFRTSPRITIPYNSLLIKKKSNIPTKARKPAVNIFLKAKHYQKLIKQGVVKNKSELAKKEGVSRARITQILNLLKLAPRNTNIFCQPH
jgi:hypothetical protein